MNRMHQINDAVVQGGKVTLTGLPFADGRRLRILIDEEEAPTASCRTITEVRRLLAGAVERFDDPTEPMIPLESWEMLK